MESTSAQSLPILTGPISQQSQPPFFRMEPMTVAVSTNTWYQKEDHHPRCTTPDGKILLTFRLSKCYSTESAGQNPTSRQRTQPRADSSMCLLTSYESTLDLCTTVTFFPTRTTRWWGRLCCSCRRTLNWILILLVTTTLNRSNQFWSGRISTTASTRDVEMCPRDSINPLTNYPSANVELIYN